jgi:hypothetical protein
MKKTITTLTAIAMLITLAAPVFSARPGFGYLYYNDEMVRTVVPPAAMPQEGRDALYVIVDGVTEQIPVIGVAPGDPGYHGGQWAFNEVIWNVDPYLLTSEAAVLDAEGMGDVTITRLPENDFKCPVQP